jgi:hypothetical protein
MNAKQWMNFKQIEPLFLIRKRLRVVSLSVNIHRPETLMYEGIFKGFDYNGDMVFDDNKILKYPFDMLTRLWEMK